MQFIIVGTGAIGGYVGGRLAAASAQTGAQVAFVARARVADELRQYGLRITDLDGANLQTPGPALHVVSCLAEANPQADSVILLCVKGGSTVAAAQDIAASCPPGVAVLSLQNGVDNVARIRAHAPAARVRAGMVPFNVVQPGPGHWHRATQGDICLESADPCPRLAPILIASGLPVHLHTDMPAVQWGKLLLNLNNPVNALSGLPLVQQLQQRDLRRVLALLQTELLTALRRAGIAPAQIASAPPWLLPHIMRLPDWLFQRLAQRMLRMDPTARSSMADDLQRGRVTEIDDLCGAVVRLGALHGLPAPANARMVELVQHHKTGRSWTGAALLAALQTSRQAGSHPP
jgi:2-dehydropantoate 2-reductase